MDNKVSLNIKISMFIIIPIITIILVFGIINIIYTYNTTKKVSLFTISQISKNESLKMKNLIDSELNYINNLKYSVEQLYNYNIRKREIYEDFMYNFSKKMSTNSFAISILFLPKAIDDDDLYKDDPIYKRINGRLGIYISKDSNNNILMTNLKRADLQADYFNVPVKTGKPYITSLYSYPIQGKYVAMYTYSIPIMSSNNQIIGVASLDVALDSMNFIQTNLTTTLFDDKGTIIFCNTDKDCTGENFANLHQPHSSENILQKVQSNESVIFEAYNKKNSYKYFYSIEPIKMFDDVYWGIEISMPARIILKNNYKMMIMIGVIISIIIILIVIIVPATINKYVVSAVNELNDNLTKITVGDISWSVSENYLKLNDEIGDMSRGINNIAKYLNDLFNTVKRKINKVSSKSNDMSEIVGQINDYNQNKSIEKTENKDYKIVNQAAEASKSLLEESKELKKIIEYFKLRE